MGTVSSGEERRKAGAMKVTASTVVLIGSFLAFGCSSDSGDSGTGAWVGDNDDDDAPSDDNDDDDAPSDEDDDSEDPPDDSNGSDD